MKLSTLVALQIVTSSLQLKRILWLFPSGLFFRFRRVAKDCDVVVCSSLPRHMCFCIGKALHKPVPPVFFELSREKDWKVVYHLNSELLIGCEIVMRKSVFDQGFHKIIACGIHSPQGLGEDFFVLWKSHFLKNILHGYSQLSLVAVNNLERLLQGDFQCFCCKITFESPGWQIGPTSFWGEP